jgi:hypothetical protein
VCACLIDAGGCLEPGRLDRAAGWQAANVLKLIVLLAIIGIVLVAWLALRGYGDGGPRT